MEMTEWKKCSRCKKPIAFSSEYFVCSVSTCNGQRTGYVFCDMSCFESHIPGARHRDAGAIRKRAPSAAEAASGDAGSGAVSGSVSGGAGGGAHAAPGSSSMGANAARPPARIIVRPQGASPAKPAVPQEILIIASRLKEYITARADMNTSASVMDVLSDYVRVLCDRAIDNARAEGRKTVMDRDFDFLKER